MPVLLASRQTAGLALLPLLLSASDWESYPWLAKMQHLPKVGTVAKEYRDGGKRKELYLEVLKTVRLIGAQKRIGSAEAGS